MAVFDYTSSTSRPNTIRRITLLGESDCLVVDIGPACRLFARNAAWLLIDIPFRFLVVAAVRGFRAEAEDALTLAVIGYHKLIWISRAL